MPAQPRKATPRKASAAVAARREVRGEKNKPTATIAVKFRGAEFTLPVDRMGSSRVYMRQKYMQQFGATNEAVAGLLFELLGRVDSARFIELCGENDTIGAAATEFFAALNKASNVPNS